MEDIFAPPYATMLEDFANVFWLLPNGLHLEQEVAHIIPLKLVGKPPFKPIYRLSHLELQEAEMWIK